MITRRELIVGAGAAAAAATVPSAVVWAGPDGVMIGTEPYDNASVRCREYTVRWIGGGGHSMALYGDGEALILFGDGSELRMPAPAAEIFRDIDVRSLVALCEKENNDVRSA